MLRRLFPFTFLLLGALLFSGCLTGRPEPSATPTATLAAPTPPTATAPATSGSSSSQSTTTTTLELPSSLSGKQALKHVEALAERIGSRPSGSAAEKTAAAYIAAELEGYGYQVTRQDFSFPQLVNQVETLTPEARTLSANTLSYSGWGEVTAPLVAVGLGDEGDWPAEGLGGSIALVKRGRITFREKVERAAASGASAVIIYNDREGNFSGSLQRQASIPAISLSQAEGERLLSLLGQGEVKVHLAVQRGERRSQNVLASLSGGEQVLVFGAHYDSVEAGPGANDNASGTATLLEMARVMAKRGYPLTLRFIAFGSEELGLIGSREYIRTLSEDERKKIVAMINLDMVGVGDSFRVGGSEELVELAIAKARAKGIEARKLGESLSGASDHASFLAAGIPAVFFYREEDPHYHTAQDTLAFVDPANLELAGLIALDLAEELAGR